MAPRSCDFHYDYYTSDMEKKHSYRPTRIAVMFMDVVDVAYGVPLVDDRLLAEFSPGVVDELVREKDLELCFTRYEI